MKPKMYISILLWLAVLLTSCGALQETAVSPTPPPTAVSTPETVAFGWTDNEIATLKSLWLGSLPDLPPDPSNAYGDNPEAAALGQQLFFDTRFSSNGQVSCATCHQPDRYFTDGLPLSQGVGQTGRGAPTIVGIAYSPWFFWDGRRDSQWSQALGPMESAVEHGANRTFYAHILAEDPGYSAQYEAIFGPLPDLSDRSRFPDSAGPVEDETARAAWAAMSPADQDAINRIYANMGKAIAAYERQIMPGPAPFDAYVAALLNGDQAAMQTALTEDEAAGLRLFIGEAKCIRCHNGPLFTNNSFHNAAVPPAEEAALDMGRIKGVQEAVENEFNCLGPYSDAGKDDCAELRYAKMMGQELISAFKVPSLRNVAETAPYMHAGQFATLAEVLDHYNHAPVPPIGHSDLVPLNLSDSELAQLEAFLRSLSGPLAVDPALLAPPEN
ncbi:MAG TPA: cytochrome-c peroxidase [Anaerolineae bacterium]|nr:cytochrome-c peroxidase [Anaerolineae bacterium]